MHHGRGASRVDEPRLAALAAGGAHKAGTRACQSPLLIRAAARWRRRRVDGRPAASPPFPLALPDRIGRRRARRPQRDPSSSSRRRSSTATDGSAMASGGAAAGTGEMGGGPRPAASLANRRQSLKRGRRVLKTRRPPRHSAPVRRGAPRRVSHGPSTRRGRRRRGLCAGGTGGRAGVKPPPLYVATADGQCAWRLVGAASTVDAGGDGGGDGERGARTRTRAGTAAARCWR